MDSFEAAKKASTWLSSNLHPQPSPDHDCHHDRPVIKQHMYSWNCCHCRLIHFFFKLLLSPLYGRFFCSFLLPHTHTSLCLAWHSSCKPHPQEIQLHASWIKMFWRTSLSVHTISLFYKCLTYPSLRHALLAHVSHAHVSPLSNPRSFYRALQWLERHQHQFCTTNSMWTLTFGSWRHFSRFKHKWIWKDLQLLWMRQSCC